MPFIPAVNTARCTFHQALHSENVSNTIYVQKSTAWSVSDLGGLATVLMDWWNNNLAPNVSINLSLEKMTLRDMTTEEAPGIEVQAPALSVGEIAGQAAPGNVALAIKLVTGLTGRNRRGRLFLAGIAEDDTEGNVIDPVRLTPIIQAFNDLRTEIADATYNWVVASFYNGTELVELPDGQIVKRPTPRATALMTPITSCTADGRFDSMRRRLQGRGT